MKLALLVANRGFFPSSVIDSAYSEMEQAFAKAGIECLAIDRSKIKYGAVETTAEGTIYRAFLNEHRGEYDGVVICLPNFGDENGIKAALRDCDLPILLQAYPDEIGSMDFSHRRDAFCGKMALTSVFAQMGKKFTAFTPFVVHPLSEEFDRELRKFAAVCRVVKKMKHVRLGAFGARTTAFKSVRYDESALEKHGIDVETYDLSAIFAQIKERKDDDPAVQKWLAELRSSADFCNAPAGRDLTLAKYAAVVWDTIEKEQLDAVAIRCWSELQTELGITPCAAMGIFNHRGIPAVCEMDVTNAITMLALSAASELPSGCMDWNNNYGTEENKCIVFHCGPLALELMEGPGVVEQHKMLSKSYGDGCSWGLNVGKVRSGEITFAGGRTENGEVQFYTGKGRFTGDPVEKEFFGIHAVLETENLQNKLKTMSDSGFRHHVTFTHGAYDDVLTEALVKYLGYRQITL